MDTFRPGPETKILDLGSEDGSNIASILRTTSVRSENVFIADISENAVNRGQKRYGFVPVVIPESTKLPFSDGFFDVVYCSSVIEHVTVPKSAVWTTREGKAFRQSAYKSQEIFASEIQRVGKRYFVQTPHKWFPVESHTWLPFLGYLPRRVLVPLLKITNRFWVKETTPDWNLLSVGEMQTLFADSDIIKERFLGLTKSIMAIRK